MGKMVDIDEALLARASDVAGIDGAEAVVAEALRSLIEREAARDLIALGGSMPDLRAPPRRRPPDFYNPS